MSEDHDKENIASGLFESVGAPAMSSSLRKKDKSRSASMGPASNVQLKEQTGNRRKSMMPTVKSILSAAKEGKANKDEIAKRKAARRKSLANRRVSFAPEATLHTWDVIEYMRDATSSSASSEEARRASSLSQVQTDTPTRISNGAETLNLQVPAADLIPEAPSPSARDDETHSDSESTEDDDDMGDATMELDDTVRQDLTESADTTFSSSKLDNALRQATIVAEANTRPFSADLDADQTMDLVHDEVTSAFMPWFRKNGASAAQSTTRVDEMIDEENIDPAQLVRRENLLDHGSDSESNEDATMDVTVAFGGIIQQQAMSASAEETVKKTTRRRSSVRPTTQSSGSPVSRPNTRRSLTRRRSSAEPAAMEDETMDFTMAIGGIQRVMSSAKQQDVTSSSLLDATMDFTVAVGSIQNIQSGQNASDDITVMPDTGILEDLSMELTANLGKTIAEAINTIAPSPTNTTFSIARPLQESTEFSNGSNALSKTSVPPVTTTQRQSSSSPRKSVTALVKPTKSALPISASTPPSGPNRTVFTTPEQLHTPSRGAVSVSSIAAKTSIADGLRMLATPRKEILPTPAVPVSNGATPRRHSPKKATTPRRKSVDIEKKQSPQKRVRLEADDLPSIKRKKLDVADEDDTQPIQLSDFLSMTGIRFLDLTTTKRRATGFPGADNTLFPNRDNTVEELEPNIENKIVAAVSTQPMLQMYQHSCTEMRSYIASGRTEIKNIEASVLEVQPPLFRDYANATFAEKSIMDSQLRDLKTNARLQSKSSWHTWRSQLLNDLKKGLSQTAEELQQDEKLLVPMEAAFAELVPSSVQQEEGLQVTLKKLQQRKADVDSGVEADLEHARQRLLAAREEQARKAATLEILRQESRKRQIELEDARSWKGEVIGAIKEADRISEECRGWSAKEVLALGERVSAIEQQSGWKICSANSQSVTLVFKDILITVDPRSWLSKRSTPHADKPNTAISITCTSASETDDNSPSATVRRFFLQYVRAQAYALPQSCTRISHLLALVQNGWDLCSKIFRAVDSLQVSGTTNVHIQGDEKLGIQAFMFLPMLQTKVRVDFSVSVSTVPADARVTGTVEVAAHVVYGERYDEPKMASFLEQFVSSGQVGSEEDVQKWAHGFDDLKDRLIRTGRKGTRRE